MFSTLAVPHVTSAITIASGSGLLGLATSFSINGSVSVAAGAVPEPACWAMMIVGMGLVGTALRRRRVEARFAS